MSTGVSLAVIAGSLFVIALVWIAITRRPSRPSELEPEPEPAVAWLRPREHRTAHAFRTAELRAPELPEVEALAFCGRWPRSCR